MKHYFTTNWAKYHKESEGYAFYGVISYIFLEETDEVVPVLVYKNSESLDYLYTSD